ncbi:hypothetical protein TI04_02835 [Achromatium sp. WMS2]|nr:hypothetical protein TI04_02835 [Achromatium sp. WMS2]
MPSKTKVLPSEWLQRTPEIESMENPAENAAYDQMAANWLAKLVYPALMRTIAIESRTWKTVLDACCGSGCLTLAITEFMPQATVLGADLSGAMLLLAKDNIQAAGVGDRVRFAQEDVAATSFDDNTFDAALTFGALHHWINPTAVFAELARIVRSGGTVLVGDLRRDPQLLKFFIAFTKGLERSLLTASVRAAYVESEIHSLLDPDKHPAYALGLKRAEWQVKRQPFGLMVLGQIRS